MGIETRQNKGYAEPDAIDFVADKGGQNVLHVDSASRIAARWIGVITATSPGVIQGLGQASSLTIPGGAMPIGLRYWATNPGSTGGTITVGIDTTSTYFLNAQSVATLALSQQQTPTAVSNLFTQLAALPVGSAHSMSGFFAQTATSTAAGPFYVQLEYYLPDPA